MYSLDSFICYIGEKGCNGDGIETPEFLNDEQMFNYVSSLLLKVLHDCEPLLTVSGVLEGRGVYRDSGGGGWVMEGEGG